MIIGLTKFNLNKTAGHRFRSHNSCPIISLEIAQNICTRDIWLASLGLHMCGVFLERVMCAPCHEFWWIGPDAVNDCTQITGLILYTHKRVMNFKWILHRVSKSYTNIGNINPSATHDDVIKWKHFPRYWPFVRGIHRSPLNSPHKGQWRGALMFSLICVWINGWVHNREAGDLRRYHAHYDVIVMEIAILRDD